MQKIMKRVLAICLAAWLVLGAAPAAGLTGFADLLGIRAAAFGGSCGSGVSWSLDTSTGVLEISGTGSMTFYDAGNAPWISYQQYITTMIIGSGVTSISTYPLNNMKVLERFIVDAENANYSSDACGALYNKDQSYLIKYPCGASCASYVIPDTLTSFAYTAFWDCKTLQYITVAEDNTVYCSDAYGVLFSKDMTRLVEYPLGNPRTAYTIPDGVESIRSYALMAILYLEVLTIPESLTSVGTYALTMGSLREVYYKGTQEQWSAIRFDNSGSALTNATIYTVDYPLILHPNGGSVSATNMAIPAVLPTPTKTYTITYNANGGSVSPLKQKINCVFNGWNTASDGGGTSYDAGATYDVSGYSSLYAQWADPAAGRLTTPARSGCNFLGWYTSAGESQGDDGTLVTSDTIISADMTLYARWTAADSDAGDCGDNLHWSLDMTSGVLEITGTGPMWDYTEYPDVPWFSHHSDIQTVSIGKGLTSIGAYAFYRCENLTSVTIPSGVTSIGTSAFGQCTKLTGVTIPADVKSFGDAVFSGCSKLASVTVPADLTYIGKEMFKGCTALTGFTIPAGVTSIGDSAFENCSKLGSAVIPNGVTSIDEYTFYGCSSMTSVTIPNGVTSIGEGAFSYCKKLTSVTIPNSVTTIGNTAFSTCEGLASVTIPDSVTSIGDLAFANCKNVVSISIGKGVTHIGDRAFYNNGLTSCLTSITVGSDNAYFSSDDSGVLYNKDKTTLILYPSGNTRQSFSIPAGVTRIHSHAFFSSKKLSGVTIPTSVKSIGQWAFAYCDGLLDVTIPVSVNSLEEGLFYCCKSLAGVTIAANVTSIGEKVFYKCSALNNVYYSGTDAQWNAIQVGSGNDPLQNASLHTNWAPTGSEEGECGDNLHWSLDFFTGVLEITGTGAMWDYTASWVDHAAPAPWYAYCENVKTINVKNGVTRIGSNAFSECACAGVTIPDSVTQIGDGAFAFCFSLINVTIPDSVQVIGNEAFEKCANLSKVTIGSGVKAIGEYAFCCCENVADVTIPNGVTSVGAYAFSGCVNMTRVTIANSVTSIGNDAFADCSRLLFISVGADNSRYSSDTYGVLYNKDKTELMLYPHGAARTSFAVPNSVQTIDASAFSGCSGLAGVTIPDSVTRIGDYAFSDCENLANVTIPNSVTAIGDGAFSGCSKLAGISVPGSVTNVGEYAFSSCSGLQSAVIENGVTGISSSMFGWCKALESVTIPGSVTEIGKDAFYVCTALKDVYYVGTKAQWDAITIESGNDRLRSAALHTNESTRTLILNANGGSVSPASMEIPAVLPTPTKSYTVTFDANGGSVAPRSKTADCTFRNWNTEQGGSGTSYNAGASYTADSDATLYAQWSDPTAGALPVPTHSGCTFDGWFTSADGGTPVTSGTTISSSTTLYAHWTAVTLSGVAVKTMPTKTVYTVGEAFDQTGLTLTATYSDGSTQTVTEGFACAGFDSAAAGTKTITVTYEGKTATFTVTVQQGQPENVPSMSLSAPTAKAGSRVDVTLSIENNPGIIATSVNLTYDTSKLRLVNVQDGGLFGASSFSPGHNLAEVPYTVVWEDGLSAQNYTANGVMATFTFEVLADAPVGKTPITLQYIKNSTIDVNIDEVEFAVISGGVEITQRTPGDVNDDGVVDLKDVVVLRRFLSGGWNAVIDAANADVNGDNTADLKDVVIIRRYLSGGWHVTLQ